MAAFYYNGVATLSANPVSFAQVGLTLPNRVVREHLAKQFGQTMELSREQVLYAVNEPDEQKWKAIVVKALSKRSELLESWYSEYDLQLAIGAVLHLSCAASQRQQAGHCAVV